MYEKLLTNPNFTRYLPENAKIMHDIPPPKKKQNVRNLHDICAKNIFLNFGGQVPPWHFGASAPPL